MGGGRRGQHRKEGPRIRIPEPATIVLRGAGGDESPAVRAEGQGPDGSGMSPAHTAWCAGVGFPQTNGAVVAAGGQTAAVRAEAHRLADSRCFRGPRRARGPVAASHNRMVRSPEIDARRRPSGLKATPKTGPSCPVRTREAWSSWL